VGIHNVLFDDMAAYYFEKMQDLKKVKKSTYWFDLCFTAFVAWASFFIAYHTQSRAIVTVLLIISAVFLYRGLCLVHEVAHHASQIKGYRMAWDLFFGIPFLYPSYVYEKHLEHHRTDVFGSDKDAEYFILRNKMGDLLYFLFWGQFILPAKAILRSLVFPGVFFSKKFATFFEMHLSNFYLNPEYEARLLPKRIKEGLYKEDICCSLLAYVVLALIFAQVLSPYLLLYWYAAAFVLSILNSIRVAVCTHNYTHLANMDRTEQIADSYTLNKVTIISTLIAPFGLRYHALHHMFPGIPYHSLGKAHTQLCKTFPDHPAYKATFTTIPEQLRKYCQR
jgi:fatty acid desaturase